MPVYMRSVMMISGLVVVLGLATYPIIFYPKAHPEYYRERQRVIRDKVPLEETQPGGMKVWSDPFDRDKKTKS